MAKNGLRRFKKRQRDILAALASLGGKAKLNAIVDKVKLNAKGVSRNLAALAGLGRVRLVCCRVGKSGEAEWELIRKPM